MANSIVERIPDITERQQTTALNYRDFSRCLTYRDEVANMLALSLPYLGRHVRHGDAASGTGTATQIFQALMEGTLRTADIFAIDPDSEAQTISKADTPQSSRCKVHYILGKVQDLPNLLESSLDSMSIIGGFHEFPPEDQSPFLNHMNYALTKGGIAILHSYFTTIAMDKPGLAQAWAKPVIKTAKELGGTTKPTRDRLLYRTPEEIKEMMNQAGFEILLERRALSILQPEELVAISRYPGYFEGALSRWIFPPEVTPKRKSDTMAQYYFEGGPLARQAYGVIARKVSAPRRQLAA